MPAVTGGGPGVPELPHTWRPYGARLAAVVLGGALVALLVAVWIFLGADVRARFTWFQRGTMVFMALLAFVPWFALVRSRVTATPDGLVVVNGYRRRFFEWAQVVEVGLRRGAPWASLDVSDGTSVAMFAIQGSDGSRARTAVRQLRLLMAQRSGPPT